jgi:1-phosphofructokinase
MKPAVITITLNPSLDKTAHLDHLEVGGLNRVQQVRIDPGGKGINVAKLIKNFDIEVLATGLAGGAEGHALIGFLEQAQIQCDFMKINGRTRTNLKIVDTEKKITTEINEVGPEITAEELQLFHEQLPARLNDASYLVLGGSIPPGVDYSIYFNLIEMANSKGIKTVLDADGEAFRQALKAIPYAIKPNIHELEEFYGKPLKSDHEIVAAGQEILNSGVSVVMVSMGERGAIIMNQSEAFLATPFPISPKSTVGAGDAMVAGFIYAMIQQKSLEETAALTTAAGTLTALKEGTQMCTLAEIMQNVARIKVCKL